IFFSAAIRWPAAMLLDCAFLLAVAAAAAIEIVAGRNWRNLKMLLPLLALLAANLLFHLEAALGGGADIAPRLALAAGLTLILIVGGRIVPSFARNWLARINPGRLPKPFGRFDMAAILV